MSNNLAYHQAALSRRAFHVLAATVSTSLLTMKSNTFAAEPASLSPDDAADRSPVAIATWDFGLAPCKEAVAAMRSGGSAVDAVEKGIRIAESDAENRSVGIGGIPNADGVVQLDACIMTGERKAGSVAALEGFEHPISVARRVLEQTPHVMLAGEGAAKFAAEQGFAKTELLVQRERDAYARWLAKQNKPRGGIDPVASPPPTSKDNHDTIALLAADGGGRLAGGCSTSGWGYKLPGRVGDSPIIGSGLYVDGQVGAAGATGLGEIMMRYCGSFLVVEAMRRGASPEDACAEAVHRILDGEGEPASKLSVNFIAISKDGTVGAAGTDAGFTYAVVVGTTAEIRKPLKIS